MSLVDHDSWDIEYEGCERLRHQLLVQLNQRRQHETSPNSTEYVKLTGSIHSGLEQLNKDVSHLKVVLDNAITWETSPESELQQRRIDWDKLTSELRVITTQFNTSTRADQAALSSSSVWQNAGPSNPTPNRNLDAESMKRLQTEMLENQNRGLEVLSATIGRQRELATVLGNEVEDQNNILDNLSNTMDRVESGVQRDTRSIGQINRTDSTCGYWLVIIALFVAIIIVLLV
ncbi:syntaxin-8 [Drosophila albomicans]|uniref:Syntaxin-8 n=1 Tax=Drosophila albomicans TaxID=7291 RepID=A0A6P8XGJ0_DROAB|nr:syntaxin-8 [Drosophila albomicans]